MDPNPLHMLMSQFNEKDKDSTIRSHRSFNQSGNRDAFTSMSFQLHAKTP